MTTRAQGARSSESQWARMLNGRAVMAPQLTSCLRSESLLGPWIGHALRTSHQIAQRPKGGCVRPGEYGPKSPILHVPH